MKNKLTAFIPLKENSQRIPGKNFRIINKYPLYHWVIYTLHQISTIDEVIIDTDSSSFAQRFESKVYPKVVLVKRSPALIGDDISMNLIIESNFSRIKNEHILQTHVTNPLLSSSTLQQAIVKYQDNLKRKTADSLYSVTRWQKRFFYKKKPVNHDLSKLIQTQDLEPVYEENSNFYIFSKASFKTNKNNRLGKKPMMFPMKPEEAIDIDYEYEFLTAEALMKVNS